MATGRLPNADRAIVTAEKIRHYLLNPGHPAGWTKSRVFAALGFRRRQWRAFRRAMLEIALTGTTIEVGTTHYGRKYLVRGILNGVNDRSMRVATVWIVLHHEGVPRLVTAYPEDP